MLNLDENLAFAPATELRALIADKQITSTELTELYLSRIEALDDQLHSFITLTPEIALEEAAKADAAIAKGESLGPLHGLPISIKDLQMTKGVRTTGGSLAYKDRVPDANAAYIDKIFDAGAVMLGKTNTPEFGHLGTSDIASARHAAIHGIQNEPQVVPAGRRFLACSWTLCFSNRRRRWGVDPHTCQLQRHLRHQADSRSRLQLRRN